MRVYISGAFTARERLRPHAEALRAMGHEITGDWLYEPARPAHLNDAEWDRALAEKDIAQVYAADRACDAAVERASTRRDLAHHHTKRIAGAIELTLTGATR